MAMKYIVLDQWGGACDVPIIFPSFLTHIDTSNRFGGPENVLSAGMASFNVDCDGLTVECYGESESLKKKSREEDETIVSRALKLNCI